VYFNKGIFSRVLLSFVSSIGAAPTGTTQFLSKITRTDPALIQYAAQAFGTINLSEEDWKKAEDHYKVMFITTTSTTTIWMLS
jgi:hypothetical protein